MNTCYIVVHCDCFNGSDACVFRSEGDAEKSVREDVAAVVLDLEEQGYKDVTVLERSRYWEIYVPDSDIYYEWSIMPSTIR